MINLHDTIKAITIIVVFLAAGCANTPDTNEDVIVESDHLIQITQEQFDSYNMKIGEVVMHNFDNEVICNGYISAPANGIAQISAHISGIADRIDCSLGDEVKKGQILASLSSTELIRLQQNLIETSAKLMRLKADYERSNALLKENIGSKKEFIAIESEYKAVSARYQSLKLQLELLSLNVAKIENGELYSVLPIVAPIDGYITNINVVLGQAIDEQKALVEIVDINKLQLQLSIFESDVRYLKAGQDVKFNSLGEENGIHSAKLISVGKTIDMESMTILCTAEIIADDTGSFVNRSYIEAKIIVDQKSAAALPSEAIIKSGEDYYVFVVDKTENQMYFLRKEKVNIGNSLNGYTEIIGGGKLSKVVTNGVYNLN